MKSTNQLSSIGLAVLLAITCFTTVSTKPVLRKPPAKKAPVKRATTFKPACASPSYPTPAPVASLGIDAQCGLPGSGIGPEGQQNMAKNNFCERHSTNNHHRRFDQASGAG